jgi:hypothetical protein
MAVLDALYVQGKERGAVVATLATLTSTAELAIGNDLGILVCCTGDSHIRFGLTGMGAADATDTYIPAKTMVSFGMGPWTHVRIYNPTGGNIDVHYSTLSKF